VTRQARNDFRPLSRRAVKKLVRHLQGRAVAAREPQG
jgi:hypothetical protein